MNKKNIQAMARKKMLLAASFFLFGNMINQLHAQVSTKVLPNVNLSNIDSLMKAMTIEQKVSLVMGTGMEGFNGSSAVVGETFGVVDGAAGTSYPLKKLGVPSFVMTDGPAGVRISATRKNNPNQTFYATAFPVGIAIASSWNPAIAEKVGKAMGNEVLEYNCDVLLAPALNIQRNPLNGRNFEYYSEDPLIAGKIAAGYVNGVQSNGVGTSVKHFVANNQETNRMSINEHIGQRALRELYLRGFEIAIKESQPWTIMTSYNKVNGTYTSANKELLTDVLRKEWGYKGLVMTDWFGGFTGFSGDATSNSSDVVAQLSGGNDLLMPGVGTQHDAILKALKNGTLTEEILDVNVKRILELIAKSPKAKSYPYTNKPDLKAHALVDREAAVEGMVLLKNEQNTLPVATGKKLAIFGNTSYDFIAGGTGSGDVHRAYTISLVEGLQNAGFHVQQPLADVYKQYVTEKNDSSAQKPIMLAGIIPLVMRPSEMPVSKDLIEQNVNEADGAIITIGRQSGEFIDRKDTAGDYRLTSAELALIDNVSSAFHAKGKKVTVILNIGGVIEMESWKNKVDAILLSWQLGQEGGNAVADILSGKVSPSGRLAVTFPMSYADVPASDAAGFGGLPKDNPKDVYYKEGVYVGYRYYTTFNKPVSYPFGYGLSYTKFKVDNLSLSEKDFHHSLKVSVKVTNTGYVASKEVIQLYLSAPKSSIDKPVKELKAFAKTDLLAPGASQTIILSLDAKSIASFHTDKSAWIADKGNYTVAVGSASNNTPLTSSFHLSKDLVVEKVSDVLKPQQPITELHP